MKFIFGPVNIFVLNLLLYTIFAILFETRFNKILVLILALFALKMSNKMLIYTFINLGRSYEKIIIFQITIDITDRMRHFHDILNAHYINFSIFFYVPRYLYPRFYFIIVDFLFFYFFYFFTKIQ